jgi:hypothetical protein
MTAIAAVFVTIRVLRETSGILLTQYSPVAASA